MNPGKVTNPYGIIENRRVGTGSAAPAGLQFV